MNEVKTFSEKYKTLIKEIKDDQKWKDICSPMGRMDHDIKQIKHYSKHFTELIQFLSNYPWQSSEN